MGYANNMIAIKRAYETPAKSDGVRILVDRLWPRGVLKAKLKLDAWEKELAPSTKLRQWFGHDPKRWSEFKKRYKVELHAHRDQLRLLKHRAHKITLVYAAKDTEHNHAVVLREVLERI